MSCPYNSMGPISVLGLIPKTRDMWLWEGMMSPPRTHRETLGLDSGPSPPRNGFQCVELFSLVTRSGSGDRLWSLNRKGLVVQWWPPLLSFQEFGAGSLDGTRPSSWVNSRSYDSRSPDKVQLSKVTLLCQIPFTVVETLVRLCVKVLGCPYE